MKSSIKISAVIITYNEEDNIGRCLDSVRETADEIVVVDSFSSDATAEVCKSRGVEFIQHPFEGHIEQKNYALSCAGNDYVLSLTPMRPFPTRLSHQFRQPSKDGAPTGIQ